jgi:hypothetical protein
LRAGERDLCPLPAACREVCVQGHAGGVRAAQREDWDLSLRVCRREHVSPSKGSKGQRCELKRECEYEKPPVQVLHSVDRRDRVVADCGQNAQVVGSRTTERDIAAASSVISPATPSRSSARARSGSFTGQAMMSSAISPRAATVSLLTSRS